MCVFWSGQRNEKLTHRRVHTREQTRERTRERTREQAHKDADDADKGRSVGSLSVRGMSDFLREENLCKGWTN